MLQDADLDPVDDKHFHGLIDHDFVPSMHPPIHKRLLRPATRTRSESQQKSIHKPIDSRFLIIHIPQRVRGALHHEVPRFVETRERAVRLHDARDDAGDEPPAGAGRGDLLLDLREGHRRGRLRHAVSLPDADLGEELGHLVRELGRERRGAAHDRVHGAQVVVLHGWVLWGLVNSPVSIPCGLCRPCIEALSSAERPWQSNVRVIPRYVRVSSNPREEADLMPLYARQEIQEVESRHDNQACLTCAHAYLSYIEIVLSGAARTP